LNFNSYSVNKIIRINNKRIVKYKNNNNKPKDESPEEDLMKDLVSIINVFSAKLNGMCKYKNK
jgi:predicted site-specific integrase-resolvase